MTLNEAWKAQYHYLQAALGHGKHGFDSDCQMAEGRFWFNPGGPHVTLQVGFPAVWLIVWKPVMSDLELTSHGS